MMSKELLKKAGILGVTFGLLASPLAFADTTDHSSIEQNQDSHVDEDGASTQSTGSTDSGNYDSDDLTTDHGTQGPDAVDDPESTDMSGDAEYTPEDVVEENSAS
ncbi:hypothetical protein LCGC14_0086560 [marine sediment metagenome]|uniref:Uncharacterized protein n=1 Tax=marine sediment metagenome TaxID=412755 RepID=A0A0F9VWF4_9ZZZZ|nr:hypothetical protein [Halomonas sp.]HDZ46353.1 hypothetical protein [Halomonas sp.]HEB04546.1 hypothetical protein [Halomonas sp.]